MSETTYVIQTRFPISPVADKWKDHHHFPDEEEARVAFEELLTCKRGAAFLYRVEERNADPKRHDALVMRLVARTDAVLIDHTTDKDR